MAEYRDERIEDRLGRDNFIPRDFPREQSITLEQFRLTPDVPPNERQYFEQISMMFSKTMATAFIEKENISYLSARYNEIQILMKLHLYQLARDYMSRVMMIMQSTRSVHGFQTLYGQQGITRVENIKRISSNQPTTRTSRFGKIFGGGKKEEQSTMQEVGMERNE